MPGEILVPKATISTTQLVLFVALNTEIPSGSASRKPKRFPAVLYTCNIVKLNPQIEAHLYAYSGCSG